MGLGTRTNSVFIHAISFFVLTFGVGISGFAQQPKLLAPHEPIAPKMKKPAPLPSAAMNSMVGGPWIIDANFKSTVYLKNVVETSPITVTPVLHLSNAARYVLPAITLVAGGTGTVDINAALQNLGISSFATLSGYVELQYQWPWVPLCAFIRDVDVAHSVIFTFGVQASGAVLSSANSAASQVTEGLWWKQEANVTGFLTLANISSQPITAVVQVSDDHSAVLGTQTITVTPQGMKTVNLQELLTAPTNQGGLRISYVGQQGALLINGGLQDTAVGYSANLYFSADPITLPSQAKLIPQNGVAELGLMVGAADPMMHFPAGTTFTPYSVLRNVSNSPITINPNLWWMQNGTPASAPLTPITLLPFETQSLNMPSLLAAAGLKNFSGSVNLVFDYTAKSGLLLAAGSVDQTNTYVFEVAPRVMGESAGKSVSYWSTANGDDTMITIWNPADEAQDFTFRIEFIGGHYLLPIHLEPRATRTFNISQIIQAQIPDAEGNIIPAAVQSGSAKLIGSQADNQHILAAMDGGIYNVVKATCGGYCMGCDGATMYYALIDGFYVPIGYNTSESLMAQWDTGSQYDLTSQSSWSSSNTNTATVQGGSVHGVAVGSISIIASDPGEPDYVPYQCFGQPFNCAFAQGGGGSAPGNITPSVSFSNVQVQVGGTATITATVTPSGNTVPISLSISGSAAIVSPTGTFTQSTSVIVKGLSVGTATITATVSTSDGGNPDVGSTSFQVVQPPPVISGGNVVWWFNGQNPASSAYPISVVLTSSAGSSTSWSVSQSDAKVNLSSTSGTQITITSTGTHFSAQNGDISITATANGLQSSPFTMTAKTPWKLSFVSRQTFCNSSPQTYGTELTYDLIDNLSATMSTDITWNESVGTAVCENGSNWCNYAIVTGGGSTNPLTDDLAPPNLNVSPAPNPTPICNGQGSGTTRYRSFPQTIYVGNSNSGGMKAQSDTLGYYIDHGQHDSIQSPSQPPQ